jgi:hypothetical protein
LKRTAERILVALLLMAIGQTSHATATDPLQLDALEGGSPVTIAGVTFDVQTGSRYVGTSVWELESRESTPNATACQERAVQVVTELERSFGTFRPPGKVIAGEAVIRVGTGSEAKISAAEKLRMLDPTKLGRKDPGSFWFRARHDRGDAPGEVEVQASADYQRDENHSCRITLDMKRIEAARPDLAIAFDATRLLARPTIAYRKNSLSAIGVPQKPLKFVVPCRINTATGKILACFGGGNDPHRKLASDWAIRYQLKLDNPDPDDQRVFDIDVPVTMGPDDIRSVDVSTGVTLNTALLRVIRGHQVNPDEFYPDEMRQKKIGGDITILCKVQEDGSVLCDLKPGTTSPAPALTQGAIQLGERLEVQTKLRDGTSAVGGLIERRIVFVPTPAPRKKS